MDSYTDVMIVDSLRVPAYILPSIDMITDLERAGMFPLCAKNGLLMHIDSTLYSDLRRREGPQAKQMIRKVTAHNGKMGFNWDTLTKLYVKVDSNQRQYEISQYKNFLVDAAIKQESWNNKPYAKYLATRAEAFTRPVGVASGRIAQGARKIRGFDDDERMRGLEEELQQVSQELAQAKNEIEQADLMREKLDRNILVDPRVLNSAINRLETRMHQAVGVIMDSGETQYIKSMIDPFNAEVKGVRVPQLHPIDTYTHCAFDTFSVSTSNFVAGGKTVLVFNPTAVRASPVAVFADPLS